MFVIAKPHVQGYFLFNEAGRSNPENIYVIRSITTMKLLLRRSIQIPHRYSTIASQFTQSEAKGRTLLRPVILSAFPKDLFKLPIAYSLFTIDRSPLQPIFL
jgi:hypothetical protein